MGGCVTKTETESSNSISKTSLLPPKILERIFQFLDNETLKRAVLVCKRWREVGESPAFWSGVRLMVTRNNVSLMPEVLGLRRFQSLRFLTINCVSRPLVQAIVTHGKLQRLHLYCCDLSSVEPDLLALMITGRETVRMAGNILTHQQMDTVLTAICEDTCCLTHLDIAATDLSHVNPTLLARAVNNVSSVGLQGTSLSCCQGTVILTHSLTRTSLTRLCCDHTLVSSLSSELVQVAGRRVDILTPENCNQCADIYFSIQLFIAGIRLGVW